MLNYDIIQLKSANFSDRQANEKIVGIITHCMGLSLKDSLDMLTLEKNQVSAHYFVPSITGLELKQQLPELFGEVVLAHPEQIPIIQLVEDTKKAWHAGVSRFANWNNIPGCEKGLNACTIGIEFHSEGYGNNNDLYHFQDYSTAQQDVGIALIQHLMTKHNIAPCNLLAHSSIAPARKTDPGPLFFWQKLHDNKIGYLPPKLPQNHELNSSNSSINKLTGTQVQYHGVTDIQGVQEKLQSIGFDCPQTGLLDQQTKTCIGAYCLQFGYALWKPEILTGQYISEMIVGFKSAEEEANVWHMDEFLNSLNSFDVGIFYV